MSHNQSLRQERTFPIYALWQCDFFDHVIRNTENYVQKWDYVPENRVPSWFSDKKRGMDFPR